MRWTLPLLACAVSTSAVTLTNTIEVQTLTGTITDSGSSHLFPIVIHSGMQNCATSVNSPGSGDTDARSVECPFGVDDITSVTVQNQGTNGWYIARLAVKREGAWMPLWSDTAVPAGFSAWVESDAGADRLSATFRPMQNRFLVRTSTISNSHSAHTYTPVFVSNTAAQCTGSDIVSPRQETFYWSVADCAFSNADTVKVEIPATGPDFWRVLQAYIEDGVGSLVRLVATNPASGPQLFTDIDLGDSSRPWAETGVFERPTVVARVVTGTRTDDASDHTFRPIFVSVGGVQCTASTVFTPSKGQEFPVLAVCPFTSDELDRVLIDKVGSDGWGIAGLYVTSGSGTEEQWWAVNEDPPKRNTFVDSNGATRHLQAVFEPTRTPMPTPVPTPAPTPEPTVAMHEIGCFKTNVRFLTYEYGSADSMTPDRCAVRCAAEGQTYAGVEYGRQCWCGSSVSGAVKTASGECEEKACTGDAADHCGGGRRVRLFSLVAALSQPTPQEVGCFSTDESPKKLDALAFTSGKTTVGECTSACEWNGYKYAGLEFGDECWCGNELPGARLGADRCSLPCAGDAMQVCGNGYRANVYVVDGSSVEAPASTYQGCYADTTPRTLPVRAFRSKTELTVERCVTVCDHNGYAYAGLQYHQECWCGNTLPSDLRDDSECDRACTGNAAQTCGGGWRNSVYKVDTPTP